MRPKCGTPRLAPFARRDQLARRRYARDWSKCSWRSAQAFAGRGLCSPRRAVSLHDRRVRAQLYPPGVRMQRKVTCDRVGPVKVGPISALPRKFLHAASGHFQQIAIDAAKFGRLHPRNRSTFGCMVPTYSRLWLFSRLYHGSQASISVLGPIIGPILGPFAARNSRLLCRRFLAAIESGETSAAVRDTQSSLPLMLQEVVPSRPAEHSAERKCRYLTFSLVPVLNRAFSASQDCEAVSALAKRTANFSEPAVVGKISGADR